MRLGDFERTDAAGGQVRYSTRLEDTEGNEYRLVILGSNEAILGALAEGDFDVTIAPGGSRDEWQHEMEAVAGRIELAEEIEPGQLDSLFKRSEPPLESETRVAVLLRQAGSGGTFFRSTLRFGVPPGATLTFSLPPVFWCFGQLLPESPDPDLFLRLNGPTAPIIKSSVLGGTSTDTVSHQDFPWNLFTPFFDVFGFQGTTTSITVFDFGGFRLP
jgi:hypothetical protein